MDERKKTIKELEEKRQENHDSVNLMLADLGEILLDRIDKGGEVSGKPGEIPEAQLAEYRRLQREIAESEEFIRQIETDTARLRELEEDIQRKEQQNSGQIREISASYIRLGEILLDIPNFESFTAPYRRQAEGLTSKIRSLEERLEAFEDKNGANVFAWIGKGAQSMVIRSFLSKTQENLRRLYASTGENFFLARTPEAANHGELNALVKEIEGKRELSSKLTGELVILRGERRKIGDTFGAEGSPAKQIQAQKKHILHIREELRVLSLGFGERAADPRNRDGFAPILRPEDAAVLDRVEEIRGIIRGIEGRIEKIRASLAIDDERAEIGKLKKAIEEYRQRIAAGEKAIADLEGRIEESERHIGELSLFLKDNLLE